MRYFWDVATGNLVVGQGNRTPAPLFEFKRGDTRLDELVFLNESGGQYDPGNVSIKFGVKLPGAAGYLISTADFSKTGTGATAVWTFAPSFMTTELNTALNIGGVGAELAFVDADLEFEYSIGGAVVSSKTFPCRIYRDINRGNEGTTTFANPAYPAPSEIELVDNKNTANGYCGLDANGKVASAQLPSYVDDVVEYAGTAQLPGTGETGKIYVTIDTGKTWRWSGSAYVEISPSPGSTDSVAEGTTNLYFTAARVRDAVLTGLSTATSTAIAATDSVLAAFGKLQAQITSVAGDIVNAALTGFSTSTSTAVVSTDSVVQGIGKLQAQVNSLNTRTEVIGLAVSDETTALTAGNGRLTFRMPFALTLTSVRANVVTAPTGSTLIVDINEGGTSILSTKLSIDASEKTSTTAATAAVISNTALADDAEITVDIDQVGSTIAGAGLKIWLIGTR
jgi:hypothetical protein